jgi:hypothetical protein
MDTLCSGCGLSVPGGTAGCRAIFDEYIALEWGNPISYRYHRMFVDTYCLQHPDQFCVSAKSFAAHLTGLCAAFEHKSHPSVLNAVNRWLSRNPPITKPQLPAFRGALTIAEVRVVVRVEVRAEVRVEIRREVRAEVPAELHTEGHTAVNPAIHPQPSADLSSPPDAKPDPFPIAQAIDRWARSTWQAYSALHPQARLWINQSFPAK